RDVDEAIHRARHLACIFFVALPSKGESENSKLIPVVMFKQPGRQSRNRVIAAEVTREVADRNLAFGRWSRRPLPSLLRLCRKLVARVNLGGASLLFSARWEREYASRHGHCVPIVDALEH